MRDDGDGGHAGRQSVEAGRQAIGEPFEIAPPVIGPHDEELAGPTFLEAYGRERLDQRLIEIEAGHFAYDVADDEIVLEQLRLAPVAGRDFNRCRGPHFLAAGRGEDRTHCSRYEHYAFHVSPREMGLLCGLSVQPQGQLLAAPLLPVQFILIWPSRSRTIRAGSPADADHARPWQLDNCPPGIDLDRIDWRAVDMPAPASRKMIQVAPRIPGLGVVRDRRIHIVERLRVDSVEKSVFLVFSVDQKSICASRKLEEIRRHFTSPKEVVHAFPHRTIAPRTFTLRHIQSCRKWLVMISMQPRTGC